MSTEIPKKVYIVVNAPRCENYEWIVAVYFDKEKAEKSCGRDDEVREYEVAGLE